MVNIMLGFAGAEQRQDDLFSNENFFSRGRSALKKGLKGVENVYTQHRPHLAETLDQVLKGRLKETSYPFINYQEGGGNGGGTAAGQQQPYSQTASGQPGVGGVYARSVFPP